VLSLVDEGRPSVRFIPTASADSADYPAQSYREYSDLGGEPHVLNLLSPDLQDVGSFLLGMDVICVVGGNTANLLAGWRGDGVEPVFAAAQERRVVLCGVSAGASCWFEASTTDSFLIGRADPLHDGLGLLDGSFCPHYASEPERRPRYLELVGEVGYPPGSQVRMGPRFVSRMGNWLPQ